MVDKLVVDFGARKQGLPKASTPNHPRAMEYRTRHARVEFHHDSNPDAVVTCRSIKRFTVAGIDITNRVTGFAMSVQAADEVVLCTFWTLPLRPLEGDVLNYCELVEGAE